MVVFTAVLISGSIYVFIQTRLSNLTELVAQNNLAEKIRPVGFPKTRFLILFSLLAIEDTFC